MSDTNTRFLIPSCNMDLLSTKIEALNKKAKKLGSAEIVTKVLAVLQKKEQEAIDAEDESGFTKTITITRTYYEIEVDGVAPMFDGWEFIGTLEHTEAGNIVRALPGHTLPESFRTVAAKCDHCNKIRRRKDTYVVRHNGGELKQVGHSCVRDFLGHTDPAHLAWLATLLKEIDDLQHEGGGRVPTMIYADHYLQFAAECVIRFGWTSKGAAKAYAEKSDGAAHIDPTASKAFRYMYPTQDMKKSGDLIEVSAAAIELASAALAWGKELANQPTRNDYEHNLLITCSKEIIKDRDIGILASVIPAYQKHLGILERQRIAGEKRKSLAETSAWFGTVGKREVFNITVVGEHTFESNFQHGPDTFTLFRMQDENGNVCIWKTGSHNLQVGKTYKLKATVKEHAVWKEIKQTVLQRCVVVEDVSACISVPSTS